METSTGTRLASKLCCIAFGLTPWNQAFGQCKIQLFDLPVAVVHNRALLSGEINGQPITIFVDTGSVTSFIWRSETNRLGLAVLDSPNIAMAAGGSVHVQHALVKQLALGKLTAADVDFIVVDREKPRPELAAMVLGESFFSRFSSEFDLGHGAIRLMHAKGCEPEQMVYWSKTYSLAKLTRPVADGDQIRTEVLLNGVPVSALLDSGAFTSLVTTAAAARANVTPNMPGVAASGSVTGVGPHSAKSWVGTFDTFALGDEQIRNAKLRIADVFEYDTSTHTGSRIAVVGNDLPSMLIGADFFLSHRILVPENGRDMVFTYVGGPVFQTIHKESVPDEEATPP
jgi:predicted aspartyl protease